ncbi:hypothetical protein BGZ80_002674 [Entomortierella chlamydospora]|uniref:Tubby C-terminal domain-containing protein n=1 Tax=Entomortierella chlamydospora TaxID=101097 RepID=A0A9P6T330_9FUNG|nr:hypothetical protein BGZ79_006306 [Entomortierella chlamydospora]KAG0021305.1 hypothetical protein BGZ80_002674 [Entomortierella chlamydospora]
MAHNSPSTGPQISSSSSIARNSGGHNPYGSRLLPMDSSNFLPEVPQPGGSMTYSDEYEDSYDQYDEDGDDDFNYQETSGQGNGQEVDDYIPTEPSALVQPAPNPLPEPHIINQPMNYNVPFSFGSKLDLISPKILHDIVMSPVPQGKKFMCRIVRKNEGMDKRMYPIYELSLEEPTRPQRVFLLRATKKKRSRGSYYAITSDKDNIYDYNRKASDTNYGVLGKLRSNFLGTAFNVYSNGRNPFSTGEQGEDANHEQPSMEKEKQKSKRESSNSNMPVRQELGAVIYNPNVLGLKGPRKMTILMNTMTEEGEMVEKRPTHVKDTLIGRMTEGDMSDLLVLRNKSPQWNDETNSFVLNFGGRVSLASVKNFQIVHDNDLDYIIMQFGRTSQDNFTMDCQYPMTPFQAFAFALTSFDAKLACE